MKLCSLISKNIDKIAHVFVSYFIVDILQTLFSCDRWHVLLFILIIGLLKEIIDIKATGFSLKDMLSNCFGWLLYQVVRFSI